MVAVVSASWDHVGPVGYRCALGRRDLHKVSIVMRPCEVTSWRVMASCRVSRFFKQARSPWIRGPFNLPYAGVPRYY